jgi:hypothetical protein
MTGLEAGEAVTAGSAVRTARAKDFEAPAALPRGWAECAAGPGMAYPGICRCEAIQACCEGLAVPETALEAALGAWATERRT